MTHPCPACEGGKKPGTWATVSEVTINEARIFRYCVVCGNTGVLTLEDYTTMVVDRLRDLPYGTTRFERNTAHSRQKENSDRFPQGSNLVEAT